MGSMDLDNALNIIKNTNYTNFDDTAFSVFRLQTSINAPYQLFQHLTGFELKDYQFPFLPVTFFKNHKVVSFKGDAGIRFLSSNTKGSGQSAHLVKYPELYEASYMASFRHFYGDPAEYCVLALLPGYMEREGSSLIYMVEDFVKQSNDADSGFFLYDHESLYRILIKKISEKKKTLLIGVSYALLDFSEKYTLPGNQLIIMETGGMKGRRKEMIREELHSLLCDRLGVQQIHSEYGMTELLSQAYSKGDGRFYCPPWMKIIVKEDDNPFSAPVINRRGRICVIDLANVFSCSFIETEDIGITYPDGGFEVLGRLDFSETRGCNVMVS